MESGGRPTKRSAGRARKTKSAAGNPLVRAPGNLAWYRRHFIALAARLAGRHVGGLGYYSTGPAWQAVSLWRRLAYHAPPIILAAIVGMLAIELLAERLSPREYADVRIEPNVVKPGQTANFKFKANAAIGRFDADCHGLVHRWIVDAQGVVLSLNNIDASEVVPIDHGSFQFVREFPVPGAIACGPANYHSQVTRWCNPLQGLFWPIVDSHVASFVVACQ